MSEGSVGKAKGNPLKHLLAGGVAGAVSRTVVSPLERLKILYQVQSQKKYQGVIRSLAVIYREEGWLGFMKGNGTNVIRIFPYSAVQFAAYEQYKKLFLKPGQDDLSPARRLTAGGLAGITSVTVTYPLDLVRTRLSVQGSQVGNLKYNSIADAFRVIISQEGVSALFKGIVPTVVGVAPYVGLNFMTYETLKSFVKQKWNPDPTTLQLLICGGIAGTVAQTITYPLDVLRRKMQMQGFSPEHPVYGTTWNAIKSIWRKDSIWGFYKGLVPNYLKVVPSISISFVVYENCKRMIGG